MRCWKSRCAEPPPWLASNDSLSPLFACSDHVGQLAGIGFDVHRVEDVIANPGRRLGEKAELLPGAMRWRSS
jgi:hypothetical protein